MPSSAPMHNTKTKVKEHNTRKTSTQRGYGHKWRKLRLAFLLRHPLCAFCNTKGRTTQATVVDHIIPHKGDHRLFWDVSNWQSLCKKCHDSDKKIIEGRGGSHL